MDINLITVTVTRKPNSAGTISPSDYLNSGITSLPGGHDFATVFAQNTPPEGSSFPNMVAKLNIGGDFIKGKVTEAIDPDTGLTYNVLPFHVNTLKAGCEDITVENAYAKLLERRATFAASAGLTELNNWYNSYTDANYTVTHTSAVDTTEFSAQWWLDHEINYKD